MNIKVILLIFFLLGMGAFLAMNIETRPPYLVTSRPREAHLPKTVVQNDKIILIRNASRDQVKRAVSEFMNAYNQKPMQLLVQLKQVTPDEFAITFPYDIRFHALLYMVDALYHPKGFSYKPSIMAWATAKAGDPWTLPGMADKPVMIYLATADTKAGRVFLTTNDNLGFSMGYAFKSQNQQLDRPAAPYSKPKISATQAAALPGEDLS